jgi:outer membrane protein
MSTVLRRVRSSWCIASAVVSVLAASALAPKAVAAGDPPSWLLGVFECAISENPEILAAQAGVRATRHGVIDAYLGYAPRANATFDKQRERQNVIATQNPVYQTGKAYFGNTVAYGEIVQPIVDYRIIAQLKAAKAAERGADFSHLGVQNKITYGVIEAYLLALSAADAYSLSNIEQRALEGHEVDVRSKIERGLSNSADFDDVESRLGLAKARKVTAAAAMSEAFAALERLCAKTTDSLYPLRGSVPVVRPDPRDPDQWVAAALRANPDLLAMDQTVAGAAAEVEKLFSNHLPRLDLRATDTYSKTGGSLYGGGSETDDKLLALRLSVPLFNGNGQGIQFLAAKERELQAQLNLDVRRREIIQKARTAFIETVSNGERVGILATASKASDRFAEGQRDKFKAGLITVTLVLDAERDAYRARREYLGARYAYLLNMMQLRYLAGVISPEDVAFVNSLLDPRQRPVRKVRF